MSDLAREGLDAIKGVLAGLAGDDPLSTTCYAVSGQNVRDLRAAIDPIEVVLRERMVCNVCGNPAACLGSYEDAPWTYACNDCCGHDCEDGQCFPLKGLDDYLTLMAFEANEREDALRTRIVEVEGELDEARESGQHAAAAADAYVEMGAWLLRLPKPTDEPNTAFADGLGLRVTEQELVRVLDGLSGLEPVARNREIAALRARAEGVERRIKEIAATLTTASDQRDDARAERDAAQAQVERLLDVAGSTTRLGKERSVEDAVQRVMALRERAVKNAAKVERLWDALGNISVTGCERLASEGGCADVDAWSATAEYGEDRWCDPCIARRAREGDLVPAEEHAPSCRTVRHKGARSGGMCDCGVSAFVEPASVEECPYCKQGRPFVDQDAHGHPFPKMAHVGGKLCLNFHAPGEPAPVDETIYHHGKPISGPGCTSNPNSPSRSEGGDETT